jgi:hypothetical protein
MGYHGKEGGVFQTLSPRSYNRRFTLPLQPTAIQMQPLQAGVTPLQTMWTCGYVFLKCTHAVNKSYMWTCGYVFIKCAHVVIKSYMLTCGYVFLKCAHAVNKLYMWICLCKYTVVMSLYLGAPTVFFLMIKMIAVSLFS